MSVTGRCQYQSRLLTVGRFPTVRRRPDTDRIKDDGLAADVRVAAWGRRSACESMWSRLARHSGLTHLPRACRRGFGWCRS